MKSIGWQWGNDQRTGSETSNSYPGHKANTLRKPFYDHRYGNNISEAKSGTAYDTKGEVKPAKINIGKAGQNHSPAIRNAPIIATFLGLNVFNHSPPRNAAKPNVKYGYSKG